MNRRILLVILTLALLTACQPAPKPTELPEPTKPENPTATVASKPASPAFMLEPQGFIQNTHDPVIAHERDTYYVFSTGSRIPFICSKDKVT
jgi:hypothetical protein